MPAIDLGAPPAAPTGILEATPRRLTLTLPELCLVAEHAGNAPLPFDLEEPVPASDLDQRLGRTPEAVDAASYAATLAALREPRSSLARRGLLVDTEMDEGLVGAVGLLATPSVALDLDLVVDDVRVKAWHRQHGDAVASLATADGLVFELAWFPASRWADELARVAAVPPGPSATASAVPAQVDLPFALADAASEATRTGRSDLLPILVAEHTGQTRTAAGRPISDLEVIGLLAALSTECRGRLRALAADVSGEETTSVGIVSWVLLPDGWRAIRPRSGAGGDRVELTRVLPAALAGELAPVLAEAAA